MRDLDDDVEDYDQQGHPDLIEADDMDSEEEEEEAEEEVEAVGTGWLLPRERLRPGCMLLESSDIRC